MNTVMNKVNGKVRLALVGAGGITGAHVQGILAHADKVSCVALCDISDENLALRSAQLGNSPALFQDWQAMLNEFGENIDAVDITLPHHLHAPAILDAAAAGKHIMCEKPMCTTLAEADAIVAAVKSAGVTYMSAHNQLFTPVVQKTKGLIDAGAIGTLRWLRTQDAFVSGQSSMKGTWRASVASQGGGELIDTGYHPSYLLLYLAGATAAEVRATMSRYHMDIEGEDTASVQVRFENGVIGEIFTSWAMHKPYGTHQIHAVGNEGELFGSGSELYYLPRGFSEPAKLTLPTIDSTFTAEIGHFADSLRSGERPLHSVEEGRAVLELILRARESAQGWQATAPKQLAVHS